MVKLKVDIGGNTTRLKRVAFAGAVVLCLGAGGISVYRLFFVDTKPQEPIEVVMPNTRSAGVPAVPEPMVGTTPNTAVAGLAPVVSIPVPGTAASAALAPASAAAPIAAASIPGTSGMAALKSRIDGAPDPGTYNAVGQMLRYEAERSAILAQIEAAKERAKLKDLPKPPGAAPDKVAQAAAAQARKKKEEPAQPVNTDAVELLSIVGRTGQEKAEVSINGVVVTTAQKVRLGTYFVDGIDANCVALTDRYAKPVRRCIIR